MSDICKYSDEHVQRIRALEVDTVHQERDIQEMRSLIHEVRDEVLENRNVMNNGLGARIVEAIDIKMEKERTANRLRQEARARKQNLAIAAVGVLLLSFEIIISVVLFSA